MIVISRIINVMEQKFITHQQYKRWAERKLKWD